MRSRKFLGAAAAVLAAGLVLAACGGDDDDDSSSTTEETSEATSGDTSGEATAEGDTIVDVAVATPDLSTLVTAVQAAGLAETLSGEGPFTVFAPTNEAFAAIPEETLNSLLADQELLTKVLTYHVLAQEVPASAVAELPDVATGAAVPTVEGQDVTITADDSGVTVNDATVVQADVEASNGVVHVIDKVLLPPDVQL